MASFIPGLDLNERFFHEVVRPILSTSFPTLSYSAGLIGPGSEVLGFDTPMSMDHDWGLQFFIFVSEGDAENCQAIGNVLSHQLPREFLGFPVSLTDGGPPRRRKFDVLGQMDGHADHNVVPLTVRQFSRMQLGWDPETPLDATGWLSIPGYKIGEVVAGRIFCDDTEELARFRGNLEWYPRDVWRYFLARGWHRIGELEHLMPRAGFVGDELGASLIASMLVREAMSLCFLMEKNYAPYAKWFGSAFRRLKCGQDVMPQLRKVQMVETWQEKHEILLLVYAYLANMHNRLELTTTRSCEATPFHDRPWRVIHGDVFSEALVQSIEDETLRKMGEELITRDVSGTD
jgi:uncharacterized protein DUF4037